MLKSRDPEPELVAPSVALTVRRQVFTPLFRQSAAAEPTVMPSEVVPHPIDVFTVVIHEVPFQLSTV